MIFFFALFDLLDHLLSASFLRTYRLSPKYSALHGTVARLPVSIITIMATWP
jgi:hypothetical protein